jgi:hypothetical protein
VVCGCQLGGAPGGAGQARIQGGATCQGSGGGALYMGWATTSCDMAGQGRLFCVGGSIVVGSLEPLG